MCHLLINQFWLIGNHANNTYKTEKIIHIPKGDNYILTNYQREVTIYSLKGDNLEQLLGRFIFKKSQEY